MFSQVQQAVGCLGAALDGVGSASTEELRRTLGLAKQLRSRVELLETRAAAAVAQRERHGDGGAGLLNQVGGRSRSDAARNVRAEAELAGLAGLADAERDVRAEAELAGLAGLADAARDVRAEAGLAGLADARAAVAEGEMSLANAARLAQAAQQDQC